MNVEAPYIPPGFLQEARDCLIASMLADPKKVIPQVRGQCPAEAFDGDYAKLVAAIYSAHDAGESPDDVTLLRHLEARHPALAQGADGRDLVHKAMESADSLAARVYNVPTYARALNEAWACKKALLSVEGIKAAALGGSAEAVQAAIENLVGDVTRAYCPDEGTTGEEAADRATQRIAEHGDDALPTGIGRLDWLSSGGIRPGDYWVIGARPNVGKTALALGIAHHQITKLDKVAVVITAEMSDETLMDRLIVTETGLPAVKVRKRQLGSGEFAAVQNCLGTTGRAIHIFETWRGTDTPSRIGGVLARLKAEYGDKLGICIVDYLQNLSIEGKHTEETHRISAISRGLQRVAHSVRVPLLALSQLNRAAEGRSTKRPGLADLRQSGQIEQDADLVGLLYRPFQAGFMDAPPGMAMLYLDKNRHGEAGDVHLLWSSERISFRPALDKWAWTPTGKAYP